MEGRVKKMEKLLGVPSRKNIDWRRVIDLVADDREGWSLQGTRGTKGERAIHLAAEAGKHSVVRMLLHYGEVPDVQRSDGCTAMHIAAAKEHLKVMTVLRSYGGNVDAVAFREGAGSGNGFTPLIVATIKGKLLSVYWLLRKGARVNGDTPDQVYGGNALLEASCRGFLDIVILLIDKGADVAYHRYHDGETPLTLAAYHGHNEVVEELLRRGADVNQGPLPRGYTPLHCAVQGGNLGVIRTLIAHGAQIHLVRECSLGLRDTPISLASHDAALRNALWSTHVEDRFRDKDPLSRYPSRPYVPPKESRKYW